MLKKLCLIILCFWFSSLGAAEYLVEVKVGYFRPTSDTLRDIFPDGWPNYQVELSYSPFSRCSKEWWRHFFAWGSVNILHIDGDSEVGVDDCAMSIIPVALGLKYMVPLPCCTQAYASAGLKYFWLRVDNKVDDINLRDRASGLGGAFAIGALFHPLKNLFFDFFVDYSIKHFKASNFSVKENSFIPSSVDISGLTCGVGVGLWF
jgi:hypothetical protein